MHEIFYIKGFEEPWWMFEGWERDIVAERSFSQFEEAKAYFEAMKQELAGKFSCHKSKRQDAIAFWDESEWAFCVDCDEDMQIYHGLLWLHNKKPIKSF